MTSVPQTARSRVARQSPHFSIQWSSPLKPSCPQTSMKAEWCSLAVPILVGAGALCLGFIGALIGERHERRGLFFQS